MCGIAGILDPNGAAPDRARAMATCIAHRGPDDATVYCDGPVGFGFRRLSIIDLDTGRQPISNEDGRVRVILNGEIYNYRRLREELMAAGHEFSTTSDTEVLVHLYEDHGTDMLDRLRGMFAFALWDEGRRRLLIARDHLGQKPLFWARRGDRFWFASEIKSILAAEDSFRRPNLEALHEYFSIRVVSEDRSMFEGVHKLPAGHFLELEPGGEPRIQRYWNLRYDPKVELDEAEAVDALDSRLREAVELHLVADVEVATYLSGGIDSGLVTAIAAGMRDGPLRTFSVGTPYGEFDELPAARLVAKQYGTKHEETSIAGTDISLLPRLVYHLDEPSDPLSLCQWRIAELAARRVKVVVGGDGGDELFGGYDRYYGAQYARYWAMLPDFVREGVIGRILDRVPDGFWYKSVSHRLRWLNELAGVEPGRRYPRSLSYFYFTPRYRDAVYTDGFRERVEGFDPEAAIAFWLDESRAEQALDQMLLADSMVRLPNHPVMILDRMSMAHGLEARSPFMDHELAKFAAALPVRLKVRGRRRRWIELKLAERYLPDEVVHRPKQGFSSALPYMMGDEYRALFKRYLADAHLADEGIVRPEAVQEMLDDHLTGQSDHGNRLWLLLNAEIWWRVHLEQVDVGELEAEMREIVGGVGAGPQSGSAPTRYRAESPKASSQRTDSPAVAP
jgi:asparagine synthase (glutamine-hydrolysing)